MNQQTISKPTIVELDSAINELTNSVKMTDIYKISDMFWDGTNYNQSVTLILN